VPEEFLCPISGALMADPVILPSGKTYERACLQACAELAFLPPGVDPGGAGTMIPNAALRAAIGTWCARVGRAPPALPSAQAAREAVLRAMPPAAAAKSVRTTARRAAALAASSSNSSYSSPASTSSYGSSSEIVPAEEDGGSARPVKDAAPQPRIVREVEVEVEAEPVDPLEDDVVGKVLDADEDGVVAAAMGALREATRESAERRRALCTPRLLSALRRVLLLPRHAAARVDAAAALVNLSLEPANKVRDGGVLASGHRTPAAVFKRFRDAGVASSTLVDVSDRIGEKHRPIAGDLHMESLLVFQPYRKYRAYKTLNLARIIPNLFEMLSLLLPHCNRTAQWASGLATVAPRGSAL
jgi:hypothetical protein